MLWAFWKCFLCLSNEILLPCLQPVTLLFSRSCVYLEILTGILLLYLFWIILFPPSCPQSQMNSFLSLVHCIADTSPRFSKFEFLPVFQFYSWHFRLPFSVSFCLFVEFSLLSPTTILASPRCLSMPSNTAKITSLLLLGLSLSLLH